MSTRSPLDKQAITGSRQGVWAVVEVIDYDDESWYDIAVSEGGRFAKFARATADYVPYKMVKYDNLNKFRPCVEA